MKQWHAPCVTLFYFTSTHRCLVTHIYVSKLDHDDVIKWKYFPRYWPFVRVIHRSPVNFPHKGQWRGALMFTLICARKNGWVNNGEAGDLRRYLAHNDVIVMRSRVIWWLFMEIYAENLRLFMIYIQTKINRIKERMADTKYTTIISIVELTAAPC